MSRVFVVQAPARRTGPRGAWEEKYDLSPAEEHGEVVRVLPYGNVPDGHEAYDAVCAALAEFNPAGDFLLLLGDPVACALAVHFLASAFRGQSFRALKWDRRVGCYRPYRIG